MHDVSIVARALCLNEVASVTRPRPPVSPDVTRHPVGPQRSCLGNKTEASPVGTAHGGGPARLNEVASVTRPRQRDASKGLHKG